MSRNNNKRIKYKHKKSLKVFRNTPVSKKKMVFSCLHNVVKKRILKKVKNSKYLKQNYKLYTHIIAPSILSLTDNTEKTIVFINALEDLLKKRENVFLHLENVTQIAHSTIVVLLSIMIKFKAQGIKFEVNKPFSQELRRILESSGLFTHFTLDSYLKEGKVIEISIEGDKIFTHSNKIVNQEISDKLISDISKMIWGSPRRCGGVQRVFIELMQNTNNHADLSAKGVQQWWTTCCYIPKERKACFAFIDYGVGILTSIKMGETDFLANLKREIARFFHPKNNAELLRLLLKGDLHELVKEKQSITSTGLSFRGNGIPGIFKALKNNHISNLVIITNNVIAKCEEDKSFLLNSDFHGTFVYWELNEKNQNLPYE